MLVRGTTNNPYLPDKARTPFATNYRYYRTLLSAQNDARYGEKAAIAEHGAVLLTDADVLTGADVYVRYDYNPLSGLNDETGQPLKIDGTRAYNLLPEQRYVYFDPDLTQYKDSIKLTHKNDITTALLKSEVV